MVPVVIVLTHPLSVKKKHTVLVFDVLSMNSLLTFCWICRSSVCFMRSSLTNLLALIVPAVGDALVLPSVSYALVFFFHHFSSAHSDSVL